MDAETVARILMEGAVGVGAGMLGAKIPAARAARRLNKIDPKGAPHVPQPDYPGYGLGAGLGTIGGLEGMRAVQNNPTPSMEDFKNFMQNMDPKGLKR